MVKLGVILLLLCCVLPAEAQSPHKTGVKINCECADATGILYASALRDAVAESPRYEEVTISESKDRNGKIVSNWQLNIVSLDPSDDSSGKSAVLAVVVLLGDEHYAGQMAQSCGYSAVNRCAVRTLSYLDSVIHKSQ
jgi:hypothetical protein